MRFVYLSIAIMIIVGSCHGLTQQPCSRRNNVLFVDDLRPSAILGNEHEDDLLESFLEDKLKDIFGKYGQVTKLSVHGIPEYRQSKSTKRKRHRRRRPYAFVTFARDESAKLAISNSDDYGSRFYRKVGLSTVPTTWRRKPHIRQQEKTALSQEQNEASIIDLIASERIDIILQVNRSHLYRVVEYIKNELSIESISVCGYQESTCRKKISLIFLQILQSCENHQDAILSFIETTLADDPYIHKGLNKVYVTHQQQTQDYISAKSEAEACLAACKLLSDSDVQSPRIKVEAFPPTAQPAVIDCLCQQGQVEITPTGHSHVLSVVRLDKPTSARNNSCIVLWGISEAWNADIGDGRSSSRSEGHDKGSGEVSRAYFKLKEAFELSTFGRSTFGSLRSNSSLTAIDCGAAPGGWTKYLLQDCGCHTVYSVDPGMLDPSVANLPGAHHMPMKAETAIEKLAEQQVSLDLYVSDMCLHDMNQQVDMLLDALHAGILRDKSMFCLTLKCTTGHSKSAHDKQVELAVQRLHGVASNISVRHLFSNRKGERTVLGLVHRE